MTESSPSSLLVRHRFLVLLVLGMMIYVPFLGMRDMWYPDEPDIAEVCQAMYVSGDWVAPRRMGEIWVDYPPMLYWAGAASAHLFGGPNEFALRFPNSLAAIALVLLTCAAASRWFDPRTGFWAGLLLLTFQQYALQAVGYRPDVLFSLFIAGGFFAYAEGAGDRPRWYLRALAFACFGAAMLAKGPLGLLLPGLVLTLWLATRKKWWWILEMAPLAAVAMAVYLPWFVACARAMGADSILYELYAQNIARFFAGARGHEKPLWYYAANIWGDLVPWSLLLPFCIGWIWRSGLKRVWNVRLLLWWFGTFFVFLSIAVTKRQLYLLPAYPAIAILMAPWLAEVMKEGRADGRPARFLALAFAVLFLAFGVVALGVVVGFDTVAERAEFNVLEMEAATAGRIPLAITGVALLVSAVWLFLAWWRRDARASIWRLGITHVVVYVLLLALFLPAMNPVKTYRPLGEWIRDNTGNEERFGLVWPELGFHKMGAFGYYSGKLTRRMKEAGEVERFFEDYPESVVIVHEDSVDRVFGEDEAGWRARVVHELEIRNATFLVVRRE